MWGGRTKEADMMMDYCVENFLQANGDFALTSSSGATNFAPLADKTLHWEFYDFYAYLNQWWITAGIRLSRFDFVPAAYEYCKANWYNPAAQAGILQAPIDSNYENCIFTSGIASQWSVLPAPQSCVLCCLLRFLTHLSAVATDRCRRPVRARVSLTAFQRISASPSCTWATSSWPKRCGRSGPLAVCVGNCMR